VLQRLSIQNFVLVKQLELNLRDGLTILSGETGAGKSILVDALGVVLGARAENALVRKGCQQSEISAVFQPSPAAVAWLQAHDFDPQSCTISRIILANGRSRSYINGRITSAQALRELGELLVDIHSQHAHQSLLKPDIQRQLLDAMSTDQHPQQQTHQAYQQWKTLRQTLQNLGGDVTQRQAQIQLLRYQVQELAALTPSDEELTSLENEHRRLAHATQLLESGQRALAMLDGEDGGALHSLHLACRELDSVTHHDAKLHPIHELAENAVIQTSEAADELRRYLDRLEIDPQRLHQVEQRLAQLQDAARKHQVKVHQLPQLFADLQAQLHELEHFEQHAASLESELTQALATYRNAARALSAQRLMSAERLSGQITANMRQLGMPKGYFFIAITPQPESEPTAVGTDHIEFLVTANPGQDPGPLAKVASGGELSRISLSIQVITAQHSGVHTLLFDEVDVGIGGAVAEIVGQQLARLANNRQVLCITHLPQVAAYGKHQLQVRKVVYDQTTYSELAWLDEAQRVEEIARMLGGLDITETTRHHAREMLMKKATMACDSCFEPYEINADN